MFFIVIKLIIKGKRTILLQITANYSSQTTNGMKKF